MDNDDEPKKTDKDISWIAPELPGGLWEQWKKRRQKRHEVTLAATSSPQADIAIEVPTAQLVLRAFEASAEVADTDAERQAFVDLKTVLERLLEVERETLWLHATDDKPVGPRIGQSNVPEDVLKPLAKLAWRDSEEARARKERRRQWWNERWFRIFELVLAAGFGALIMYFIKIK